MFDSLNIQRLDGVKVRPQRLSREYDWVIQYCLKMRQVTSPSFHVIGHGCRNSWEKASANDCPQPFNIVDMVVKVKEDNGAGRDSRQVANCLCISKARLPKLIVAYVTTDTTKFTRQVDFEALVG